MFDAQKQLTHTAMKINLVDSRAVAGIGEDVAQLAYMHA